jgi:hypothetical protein
MQNINFNRRQFLKTASSLPAVSALAPAAGRSVSLVVDPSDSVARSVPAQWALSELARALAAKGLVVQHCERMAQATGDLCVVAAGRENPAAREMFKAAGATVAAVPEALGLAPAKANGRPVLVACGHDATGLGYALLDLADRAEHAADPIPASAASHGCSPVM